MVPAFKNFVGSFLVAICLTELRRPQTVTKESFDIFSRSLMLCVVKNGNLSLIDSNGWLVT